MDTLAAEADRPGLEVPAPQRPVRPALLAATVLGAVWCSGLFCLVVSTANPVTFNLVQLASAERVVTVFVTDAVAGECRVSYDWTAAQSIEEEITVINLSKAGAQVRQEYLLPLVSTPGGMWKVCESPLQKKDGTGGALLIYPASSPARDKLPQALAEAAKWLKE